MSEKVAVIGLGYVGLPLALGVAARYPGTIGFDVNVKKLGHLQSGIDETGECSQEAIKRAGLIFTSKIEDLRSATFFIVAVPTPVDAQKRPDLTPLIRASETVGQALTRGAVVVFESTVYPGVTEDICGPVLAKVSGLKLGTEFKLGYSPERINPGDKEHTLERIIKVVSGQDEQTLDRVSEVYGSVVKAGIHRAPSIRVAEAAKVIENTQRDVNIALMNELAMIFDRMGISTRDVLSAAGTKWNFLKFHPGLVGGHCIGVDPYYLTAKAEELGYNPQVILAGRRINDGMGAFIAQKTLKLLAKKRISGKDARIGILGLTFKENVPDLRNSRVPDILTELREFGAEVLIHDAMANKAEAQHEYNITLNELTSFKELDAVILAVSHNTYRDLDVSSLLRSEGGVVVDVKSILNKDTLPSKVVYWSL